MHLNIKSERYNLCNLGKDNHHSSRNSSPMASRRYLPATLFSADYCFIIDLCRPLLCNLAPDEITFFWIGLVHCGIWTSHLCIDNYRSSIALGCRSNASLFRFNNLSHRGRFSLEPALTKDAFAMLAEPVVRQQGMQQNDTTVLRTSASDEPDYELFLIVFGSIAAFAFASAFLGCCTAIICRRRRRKRMEKEVAALSLDARSGVWTPTSSAATLATTDSTLIDPDVEAQQDNIAQRTSNLMNNDAFVGRELNWFQKSKQRKRRRGWKSSSIMLPVILDDLRQWAKRHAPSESHPEEPIPSSSSKPASGSRQDLDGVVPPQSTAHCNSSTDYEDPSELLEEIRPSGRPNQKI